jgi:hypothetical protein
MLRKIWENFISSYFLRILPATEWTVEQNRTALNMVLRRLDKFFQKAGKRGAMRVSSDVVFLK